MNTETKQLLARWQSLAKDGGLQRADSTARVLWVAGLVLLLFVVFALVYRLHPAFVAVAAAVMGWVIAERNALRTRSAQWPIFKSYIDWKRVQQDLSGDNIGAEPSAPPNGGPATRLGNSGASEGPPSVS
jgi:hypothetical protein